MGEQQDGAKEGSEGRGPHTNLHLAPQFRVSIDSYMNIQLSNAEEYIKNNFSGALGQVLIRCNNVLWIRPAKGDGENGDVRMDG